MLKQVLFLLLCTSTLIADWTTPDLISNQPNDQLLNNTNTVYGIYDASTGQVFAAWTATFNSQPAPIYSTYTSGSGWVPTAPINTTSQPFDDVVLGYINSGPNANTVAAAFSDETIFSPNSNFYTSSWGPQERLSTSPSVVTNIYLAFSPKNQTLYASWVEAQPLVHLNYFDNNTNAWVDTPVLNSFSTSNATVACDNSGNVFVAWSNAGVPTFAIFNGSWSTPVPLDPIYSNQPDHQALGDIFIVYNPITNQFIAAWTDLSRLITYSIYSNGAWSPVMTVQNTDVEYDVYLTCDTNTGQVFASWADKASGGNPYYAVFNQGQGIWTVAPISTSFRATDIVTMCFASGTNQLFAFWQGAKSQSATWSTLFVPPVPPPIPTLNGRRQKNDFATISEMFTKLRWSPSATTDILGYHVYQDGVLIATLSPLTLHYTVHNLPKSSVVFTVAPFNSFGEGSAVSITLR